MGNYSMNFLCQLKCNRTEIPILKACRSKWKQVKEIKVTMTKIFKFFIEISCLCSKYFIIDRLICQISSEINIGYANKF